MPFPFDATLKDIVQDHALSSRRRSAFRVKARSRR